MPSPHYPFKSLTGRGALFFFPSRAKETKTPKKKKTPDLRLDCLVHIFFPTTFLEIAVYFYVYRDVRPDVTIVTSQRILCFLTTSKKPPQTWPSCFSGCLRGQEILLAINFQIRSTFNRK